MDELETSMWSDAYKLELARGNNASFENILNLNRNLFQTSGLSGSFNMYRTGYASHDDVGHVHKNLDYDHDEWSSFSAGSAKGVVAGNGVTLINEGYGLAWLGNQYNNILRTGDGDDYIDGGHGEDTLVGKAGDDKLIGGEGSDTIYGGDLLYADTFDDGDDTLYGSKIDSDDNVSDTLIGGTGYDTYYVGNGDIIEDSDKSGSITFNGKILDGLKTKLIGPVDGLLIASLDNAYEDEGFFYQEVGSNLIVISKADKESKITIQNWDTQTKEALNIKLDTNPKEVTITISDSTVIEGDSGVTTLSFDITTSRQLLNSESITLDLNIVDINTSLEDYDISSMPNTITLTHTNTSEVVEILVKGDTIVEGDEYLTLNATINNQIDISESDIKITNGTGTIVGEKDKIVGREVFGDRGTSESGEVIRNETLQGTFGDDELDGKSGQDTLYA